MAASLGLPTLFERIVETTTEGVWVIDAGSLTTYVNQAMADMLGYPRSELVGMSMFDLMDDEGRRIAAANVERRRHGIAEAHEFVFRRKDGSALWARLLTSPLADDAGAYLGAFALASDLTVERSRAAEREDLWRILDESLNEIYIFRRDDLRFVYGNRGALRNLGYTLDELQALTPLDLKPEHTAASFSALLAPLIEGRKSLIEFRTVHLRRDGSLYPVEVHLQQSAIAGLPAFVAIINDIGERVAAEREARASEARLRALIEESPDLVLVVDRDGRFSFASPSVALMGYTPADVIGRSALDFVHPDDVAMVDAALTAAGAGAPLTFETRARDQGGGWHTIAAKVRGHLDNPAIDGVVVNARDVTPERKLEDRLRHAQHLGSIGRLAGGVAHDFNNILTAVTVSASFLEQSPGLSQVAREDVREIQRAATRAADLTSQLLAFASRRVVQPVDVDLGRIIAAQDRFLRRVLGEHVDLRTHLGEHLWPVHADPTQLEQIILNLAINARDAMPGGGHLTMEAANVTLDPILASAHGDLRPGPYVVLAVSDTGEGIPAGVLPHIFEPFFTTKAKGLGTGLGLATVYGIVRQCDGHIAVYSEPGLGTTFKIYLPRSPHDAAIVEPAPAPAVGAGDERVLVVEDEEIVRRLVARALAEVGYEVHTEASPADALAWASSAEAVDLLVTDVVMPGMSGKELATELRRARPTLRVLYMSGYTENTIVHRGVVEDGIDFLAKPFAPADLLARVRQALDRRDAPPPAGA